MNFNNDILDLSLGENPHWTNTTVFLLCSGGVDSVAATHYMYKKYYMGGIGDSSRIKGSRPSKFTMSSLHINHNYRLQNEQMSLKFVDFCNIEGIPKILLKLKHNKSRKKFTEDYLRQCRLEMMSVLSIKKSLLYSSRIVFVTGHHLDDCVENYMLNVIRGHTTYAPMPIISKHTGEAYEFTICRPFIFSRKKEMIDYCKKNDLMRYVEEDSTNLESKGSRRNMIRNEILPIFDRDKVGLPTIVKKIMQKRLSLDIIRGK